MNDEDHRAGRRALRSPRSPFSRCYKWHPASVTLVCDGGEELTLTDASIDSTCQCGADHSAVSNDIRARENQMPDEVTHPWDYEPREQAAQHLRDEAAYPEGSPRRYNDVTSGFVGNDEQRWKKARERRGA